MAVVFVGSGTGAGSYSVGPGKAQMAQHFMSERLRSELQQRAYMVSLFSELCIPTLHPHFAIPTLHPKHRPWLSPVTAQFYMHCLMLYTLPYSSKQCVIPWIILGHLPTCLPMT